MKLSYIVSTYHRPDALRCILSSLMLQTHTDFEVIVVDNSIDSYVISDNAAHVAAICQGKDYLHLATRKATCYHSSDIGAQVATGDYVCFPSDDSYYCPKFGEKMMAAAESQALDLVYCDIVYDDRCGFGRYMQTDTQPVCFAIDKMAFILRRQLFTSFPGKPDSDIPAPCDGLLIDALIASGVRHAKVSECLGVHN